VHDEWSHGADMFRYMASTAPKMVNDDMRPIQYHRLTR